MFFNIEMDVFGSSGIEKIAEQMYNFYIMEKCVRLQKSTLFKKENTDMEEKKLTGYPSIDKPWLKYYSEEAINTPLPECTMYEYLW
jgi:hypothetical protein